MIPARNIGVTSALRVAGRGSGPSVGRGFMLSTTRGLGLKESSNRMFPHSLPHMMARWWREADPGENTADNTDYTKHKDDSLTKVKKGEQHWKAELASDSEEAIKADRMTKVEVDEAMTEKTKETKTRGGSRMQDGS